MSPPATTAPKVALVHDWLTGMRGGEKVLEQIARAFPNAPIFTLFHFRGSVSAELESHPIHTSWLQRAPGVERHYRTLLPLFPSAVERFDLSGFELVISTSHCVAKGVVAPDGPHVCYCHTPVRYAWDQRPAYFPDDGPILRRLRDFALDRLQRWDRRTAARVDHFAANSRFVQERIRRFWERDADVVHPPVDVDSLRSSPQASASHEPQFLLSVAALSPYKRHDIAIRAAMRTGHRLVIVGDGPQRGELQTLASELASRSATSIGVVELRGRVSDEELRSLLSRARAFVQPGTEDFGIAAVEALAAGTPVVAAGEGGVLDIVEDGVHGFLYPPTEAVEGLVSALRRLEGQPFAPTQLTRRAESFSTARFHQRWAEFLARRLDPALFRRLALSG